MARLIPVQIRCPRCGRLAFLQHDASGFRWYHCRTCHAEFKPPLLGGRA